MMSRTTTQTTCCRNTLSSWLIACFWTKQYNMQRRCTWQQRGLNHTYYTLFMYYESKQYHKNNKEIQWSPSMKKQWCVSQRDERCFSRNPLYLQDQQQLLVFWTLQINTARDSWVILNKLNSRQDFRSLSSTSRSNPLPMTHQCYRSKQMIYKSTVSWLVLSNWC